MAYTSKKETEIKIQMRPLRGSEGRKELRWGKGPRAEDHERME